jgi:hypothetical protein
VTTEFWQNSTSKSRWYFPFGCVGEASALAKEKAPMSFFPVTVRKGPSGCIAKSCRIAGPIDSNEMESTANMSMDPKPQPPSFQTMSDPGTEMRNETSHSGSSCDESHISIDTLTDSPREETKTTTFRSQPPVPVPGGNFLPPLKLSSKRRSTSLNIPRDNRNHFPQSSLLVNRWSSLDPSLLTPTGRESMETYKKNPESTRFAKSALGEYLGRQTVNNECRPPLSLPLPPPPPPHDSDDYSFDSEMYEKQMEEQRVCYPRPPRRHFSGELDTIVRSTSLSPSILRKRRGKLTEQRTSQDRRKVTDGTVPMRKKTPTSNILRRPRTSSDMSEYKKHGVVQYMRPDGSEFKLPKYPRKQKPQPSSSLGRPQTVENDRRCIKRWQPVCRSDETAEGNKVAAQKKVRFSPTITTRIIQRRRSISSTERRENPLTPPKRISRKVSLISERFASGMQSDDRPSPPRRSNSMSSVVSNGSLETLDRSRDDSSTDNSHDISFESLKLPFPNGSSAEEPARIPFRRPCTTLEKVFLGEGSDNQKSRTNEPLECFDEKIHSLDTLSDQSSKAALSGIEITPRLRRRRSIGSDMERRHEFPLTPPRKVSAPLEVLLAHCSLKTERRHATPIPSKKRLNCAGNPVKELPAMNNDGFESKERSAADHDDKSAVSQTSSLSRHQAVMSETWTRITLPRRSSSRSMSPASALNHRLRPPSVTSTERKDRDASKIPATSQPSSLPRHIPQPLNPNPETDDPRSVKSQQWMKVGVGSESISTSKVSQRRRRNNS